MKFAGIAIVVASLASSIAAFGNDQFQSRPVIHATNSSSSSAPLPPSQDPWYTAPANYENTAPGTILRVRAVPALARVAANTSAAYQLLYRSTNSRYKPTFGVTTFFVPFANASSSKSPLLSYQIPYDSADVDSSPSYTMYSGVNPDITTALGKGWFVNVPDYEGPLASFVAGVQSGHSTLDSIRAVLSAGLGLPDCAKYAMWGYSGGALASEWAAELAVQYAPEMEFAGAALGGLTPNVTNVLLTVDGTFEAGLIPAGILGLASQWPELAAYLKQNLNQNGTYNATTFNMAKNYTLYEAIANFNGQNVTDYFTNGVSTLFGSVPQRVLDSDGYMGYHGTPQMPILAYKAIQDEVSPIHDTDVLVARYCGVGATINYQRNTAGSHTSESTYGNSRAVAFLTSVLTGNYNATGCQISNVTISS